jgi:hydrogenase maturation protease
MRRLLVLAYGNPLRGDDGVARHIAQALGKTLHDPSTEIVILHQLTPELAETVSKAEAVIFLDAVAGALPGHISLESLDAAPSDSATWTHILTPSSLLALSRALYRKAPARALLLTVGGGSFEFADDLSDPVRRAIPEAVRKIVELVQLQELGKLGDSDVPERKDFSN